MSRWTCAQARWRAAARNAAAFLDKVEANVPFPAEAIQIDGGFEFKAEFEAA